MAFIPEKLLKLQGKTYFLYFGGKNALNDPGSHLSQLLRNVQHLFSDPWDHAKNENHN